MTISPRRNITIIALAAIALTLISCENHYTPRPKGYLRFSFPEHTYNHVTLPKLSFDKPDYMTLTQKESPKDELWFDLVYPQYGVNLHLSCKPVSKNLALLVKDAHRFVYEHTIKSSGIDEITINNPHNNTHGIIYRIHGNVATNIQFIVTDSTKHFLRGSLYINSRPNEDSLAPIIDFVNYDINHIINSIRWR